MNSKHSVVRIVTIFFFLIGFTTCLIGHVSAGTRSVVIEEHVYSPRVTGTHGILTTNSGDVYISDSYAGTDTVYRITDGSRVAVATGFSIPSGMWQSPNGKIYVCDVGASRIYRYDSAWNQETWFSVPSPWTLVMDESDLIVASYNGNVYRVSEGVTSLLWENLQDPFGVAINAERTIFVSEHTAGRIAWRTVSGETGVLTDQLTQPEGIRMGPDGWLWAADTAEGKLYRVSMTGQVEEIDAQGHDFGFAVNLSQLHGNQIYLGCAGGNGRVFRIVSAEPCVHNGDVNFDGTLTAADAQLTFMIALGSYSPSSDEECAADCNGDGMVTAADAQQIFLAVLGSESCVD